MLILVHDLTTVAESCVSWSDSVSVCWTRGERSDSCHFSFPVCTTLHSWSGASVR